MSCSPSPVILTQRLAEAFSLGLSLHSRQVRKVRPIPYMGHLMSVAALVLEDGGSETEAMAALLHDCGGGSGRRGHPISDFCSSLALRWSPIVDGLYGKPPARGWSELAGA